MKARSVSKLYSTDATMKKVWLHLSEDFRALIGHQVCWHPTKFIEDGDIPGFRSYVWPDRLNASPMLFKTEYQLENLFKRYRFSDDMFTQEELEVKTDNSFVKTQERICGPLTVTSLVFKVLQEARKIAKAILGEYSEEEHMEACRFGKRACKGSSYARSYLDLKLSSNTLTGSMEHIEWMESYLETDHLLRQILVRSDDPLGYPPYSSIDCLETTNVPKSFKALRKIMPNSLIGSFYTYGLGKVIEKRLRENSPINISKQQDRHGRWIRKYSMDRSHVTVDLSAASDSPIYELLAWIIPRAWMKVLKRGRISHCQMNGKQMYLRSFMTMGIGFTFPVETLLFYALLKAIANLSGVRGRISAYGDDLIYPRKMHDIVKYVFPKLHIQINQEKSYVSSHFRESCGHDYYRGVDVRPFQPEGEASELKSLPYQQFLYKLINGLRRRWEPEEIPTTMHYLLTTLAVASGRVYIVPPSFPDESGFKMDDYDRRLFQKRHWEIPFSPVYFCNDPGDERYQNYVFKYLRRESDDRSVLHLAPYYWESLRLGSMKIEQVNPFDDPRDAHVITWKQVRPQPRNYRSSITGRRLRKKWAYVASKTKASVVRRTGISSSWT